MEVEGGNPTWGTGKLKAKQDALFEANLAARIEQTVMFTKTLEGSETFTLQLWQRNAIGRKVNTKAFATVNIEHTTVAPETEDEPEQLVCTEKGRGTWYDIMVIKPQ